MRPSRTGYRVRGARGYRLDRVRCAAVLSDHAWSHAGRRRADVKQTHREGRESVSGDLRGNAFCGYSRGVCADSSPAARPRQRLHATRHYRPVYDTIAGLRFSVIVTSRPTWRRYVVFPGLPRTTSTRPDGRIHGDAFWPYRDRPRAYDRNVDFHGSISQKNRQQYRGTAVPGQWTPRDPRVYPKDFANSCSKSKGKIHIDVTKVIFVSHY